MTSSGHFRIFLPIIAAASRREDQPKIAKSIIIPIIIHPQGTELPLPPPPPEGCLVGDVPLPDVTLDPGVARRPASICWLLDAVVVGRLADEVERPAEGEGLLPDVVREPPDLRPSRTSLLEGGLDAVVAT